MTTRLLTFLALSVLALTTSSCGLTQAKFVFAKEATGYSTVRGRILSVRSLNTTLMEPLADGVSVTISEGQCQVMMRFEDQRTRAYDVSKGVILVFGQKFDSLLQPQSPAPVR